MSEREIPADLQRLKETGKAACADREIAEKLVQRARDFGIEAEIGDAPAHNIRGSCWVTVKGANPTFTKSDFF